jgi:hypothetical protein
MSSCSDNFEVPYSHITPSTPPSQRPHYPRAPSCHLGSPPNTPPPFMTGSGILSLYVTSDQTQIHNFITVTSTISDTEDVFPLTPNSKCSDGAYNVDNTYAGAGSPVPSCSPVTEQSNISDFTRPAPSFEDQRLLDGLIGRSVDYQDPSETISQKVVFYFAHIIALLTCAIFPGQGWVFQACGES